MLAGAGVVLAAVVALAVTARDTNEIVRTAGVLGLDLGWAPWLAPVAGVAATLSAVTVVGLLLSAGFLAGNLKWTVAAALAWTGVTAVRICAGAAEVFGVPVRVGLHPRRLWFYVTEVPAGRALLLTLVLAAAVAAGCRFVRGANGAAVLTALAVIAVLPPVASGHASSAGGHQVIVSALMLHAASAVVWCGGLLALVLGGEPRADAVARFSRVALWCFTITVATGVVGAAARIERWSDFTSTRYGTVLLAKAGALAALGAFGWWHRRRSMPALTAGRPHVFARVAAVELLVLAATMGLAVALGRTAPPNDLGSIVFDTPLTPALRWIPEPVLLLLAAAAVTAYVAGVRRAPGWSGRRTAAWVAGWSLLVTAGTLQFAQWDAVGALQPLTAAFAVPALLAAGSPVLLSRAAGVDRLHAFVESRALRVLRGPGSAVTLYAAAGFLLAVGFAEDWASTRHSVHLLSYLLVVATGCLVWSPVARPKVVHLPGR